MGYRRAKREPIAGDRIIGAGLLDISTATVRNHIQRILKKLHCHTRLAAVMQATREGLI